MIIFCPYCMSPVSPGQLCPNCGADPASYHPSSHHFPMGHLLHDRYLVGKVLGEGGFGITYLGLDITLDRRVAIKEYFPNVFVHRESSVSLDVTCYTGEKQTFYEKGRDQFLQEARVLARLDTYPEIVRVHDFFPANNTAYIVMELLSGNPLHTLLAQQGRIPAKYLFEIMEPVLRTMDAVHRAGIIHRDISPDNIMLLNNGQVKLLDFGCARDVDKKHTMTVMLKHGFAPIEQYTGHNQGPWTDVYALCATLYYCLTGQMPPRALERIAAQDPLVPPNRLGAALTPQQEQALMRGLAVEAKDRWQSLAELHAALYGSVTENLPRRQEGLRTEFLPEQGPKPKAEPRPEPTPESEAKEKSVLYLLAQNKKLLAGIAACFLIFVVIFVYWWKNSASSSENPSSSTPSGQGTEEPQPTPTPTPASNPEDFIIENEVLIRYTGSGGAVTIPDGVTSIGRQAFEDCGSLTSVTIPNSVTSIGNGAFYGCNSLTGVTIPDSVTSIGDSTFVYCSSLTSVTIPNSVTSISANAFWGCSSLTSVTIPNSVNLIWMTAFSGCSSLTSVTIPNSVVLIAYGAFSGCSSLKDVYYGGSEAQWNQIDISTDYVLGGGEDGNDPLLNAAIHFTSIGIRDAEAQLLSMTPAELGLPGTSMSQYEVFPQMGGTEMVNGVTCIRLDVYNSSDGPNPYFFASSYLMSVDGAHLYKLDPITDELQELNFTPNY